MSKSKTMNVVVVMLVALSWTSLVLAGGGPPPPPSSEVRPKVTIELPDDFSSIQEAILAASVNQNMDVIINLKPGVYSGFEIDGDWSGNSYKLVGQSSGSTVILNGNSGSTVKMDGSNCGLSLNGLTVAWRDWQGMRRGYSSAVEAFMGPDIEVDNCVIYSDGIGLNLAYCFSERITHNVIVGNARAWASPWAVKVNYNMDSLIAGNIISGYCNGINYQATYNPCVIENNYHHNLGGGRSYVGDDEPAPGDVGLYYLNPKFLALGMFDFRLDDSSPIQGMDVGLTDPQWAGPIDALHLPERVICLRYGWNMLSVPSGLGDGPVESVLGNRIAGPVWAYDQVAGQYCVAASLAANQGYWVYAMEPAIIACGDDGSIGEIPLARLRVEPTTIDPDDGVVIAGEMATIGQFELVVKEREVRLTRLPVAIFGESRTELNNFQLVGDNGQVLAEAESVELSDVCHLVEFESRRLAWLHVGVNRLTVRAKVGTTVPDQSRIMLGVAAYRIEAECFRYRQVATVSPNDIVTAQPVTVITAGELDVKINSEAVIGGNTILGSRNVLLGSWVLEAEHEDIAVMGIHVASQAEEVVLDNVQFYDTSIKESEYFQTYPNIGNWTDYGCSLGLLNGGSGFSGSLRWMPVDPIVVKAGEVKVIELRGDVRSTALNAGLEVSFSINGLISVGQTSSQHIELAGDGCCGGVLPALNLVESGWLVVDLAGHSIESCIVEAGQPYQLARVNLTAYGEDILVKSLVVNIEDGGLNETVEGHWDDIDELWVCLAGASDDPLATVSVFPNAIDLSTGVSQVVIDLSNSDLVISNGTTAELVLVANLAEIGIGKPGTSGADFRIGLADWSAVEAFGCNSNRRVPIDYWSSMGAPVVMRRSCPYISVNEPDMMLGPWCIIYNIDVYNPTGEAIALRRLSFLVGHSPGDLNVVTAALEARHSAWPLHRLIAENGGQEVESPYEYHRMAKRFQFEFRNPDDLSTLKEMRLAPGESVNFRLVVTALTGWDGPADEWVTTSLLDDDREQDWYIPTDDGSPNFIWSDLSVSEGHDVLTVDQWFDGCLVEGLKAGRVKTVHE